MANQEATYQTLPNEDTVPKHNKLPASNSRAPLLPKQGAFVTRDCAALSLSILTFHESHTPMTKNKQGTGLGHEVELRTIKTETYLARMRQEDRLKESEALLGTFQGFGRRCRYQ